MSDELDPGHYAVLEVKDSGHEMSEEIRERIFDPFFSTRLEGRGLGLASVLGIVKAHGGAIEVISAPGQGTQFRVLFPMTQSSSPSGRAEHELKDRTKPSTVLIVDDDPTVRDLARASLAPLVLNVIETTSGAQTLEAVKAGGLDLILLDLSLPVISGFQVLRRVREVAPHLPVILSTDHAEQAELRELATQDETVLLIKPYTPLQLREAVKNLIG